MSKSRVQPIRLTAEIVEAIEKHPEFRALEGMRGGVSGWIREAIFEKLGRELPQDYHQARSEFWAKRSKHGSQ
jgi:hypothetical protein